MSARPQRRAPAAPSQAVAGRRRGAAARADRARRSRARRRARALRRALLAAAVPTLVVAGAFAWMLAGPLETYLSAEEERAELAEHRDRLAAAVDDLEDERDRLRSPEGVELAAREQLGLVAPDEVAYELVVDDARPWAHRWTDSWTPDPADAPPSAGPPGQDADGQPWWRRALSRLAAWVG